MKSNLNLPWLKILRLIVVTLAMWLPRGLELDRFVTTDEPKWLTRSANFFYALAQGEYEYTYQKEHPGVTIMWAGTAGFLSRYPYYVRETSRQEMRPQRLARFLRNNTNAPTAANRRTGGPPRARRKCG